MHQNGEIPRNGYLTVTEFHIKMSLIPVDKLLNLVANEGIVGSPAHCNFCIRLMYKAEEIAISRKFQSNSVYSISSNITYTCSRIV